jgi:hypothetical protein
MKVTALTQCKFPTALVLAGATEIRVRDIDLSDSLPG